MKKIAKIVAALLRAAVLLSSVAAGAGDCAGAGAAERELLEGAAARIERHRMRGLTVRVVDARGRPVRGASVGVEQTRHAFLFGSNIFLLDPRDASPAQRAYRERFAALFNYATLPFYWGAFEKEPGRPDYERLERMARWCVGRGITPKGHPLVWHEVYPRWAPAGAGDAAPALRRRVADTIRHYGGLIRVWDVVNEANSAPEFENGVGRWVKRDGAASVVRTVFSWARAAGGGEGFTFIYNDYNLGPENVALLTQLAAAGDLPDAVGLQSHMHQDPTPLGRMWEACETFSKFGRPLHLTEVTVTSGEPRKVDYRGPALKDWPTTPGGEARQADYVADFYTILFSHPAVEAITWWDLSDTGAWMGAPAGLLRRDMTPKPAYERLLSLVRGKWWTKAAGRTGGDGRYRARVFLGSHRISVRAGGKTRVVPAEVLKGAGGDAVIEIRVGAAPARPRASGRAGSL